MVMNPKTILGWCAGALLAALPLVRAEDMAPAKGRPAVNADRARSPHSAVAAETPLRDVLQASLTRATAQYEWMLAHVPAGKIPRTFEHGQLVTVGAKDWTSGFFPGALWYLFEATRAPQWRDAADRYTVLLDSAQFDRTTHDLGFMLYCSYGNGLRLTGNESYRAVLRNGAASLSSRFHPEVGAIRSWDFGSWSYPVIIDNMMNLELLFWAAREGGVPRYRDLAIAHADTTLKHHFRADGSTFHVVDYDPKTGRVLQRQTHQGIADSSAWARGQAWALYGYTLMFRETKDPRYLASAQKTATFIMTHPRLPVDKIPYWDFDDPAIPAAPRDSAAAAVICSALLELSDYAPAADKARYLAFAAAQLRALASPTYLAEVGANGGFLLMHATGNYPKKSEIDTPLNYADYYFLEAILRAQSRFGPKD